MEIYSDLFNLNPLFVLKWILIAVSAGVVFFSFVLFRQTLLLTGFLKTLLGGFLKILALLYLGSAIGVLVIVLIAT